MHCFTHADATARGICKSCQRALCIGCMAEVGKSVACKERCEKDVEALDEMLSQSIKTVQTPGFEQMLHTATASLTESEQSLRTSKASLRSSELLNVALGMLFVGYALYQLTWFIGVLGLLFIAFGVYGLVQSKTRATVGTSGDA
jgi:hypothetical protein